MSAESEISALDKEVEQLQKNTKQFLAQLNSITPLLKQHEALSKQYRALSDRVHKDKSATLDDENKSKLKDINSRLTRLKSDLVPTTGRSSECEGVSRGREAQAQARISKVPFAYRSDLGLYVAHSARHMARCACVGDYLSNMAVILLRIYLSAREHSARERQQHPTLVDHPPLLVDCSLVGHAHLARRTRIQNIYQAESLHDARAGSRADLADALSAGGEHSGFGLEQFTPSLLFLFPFLLSLQCFQLYHGYTLLLRVVQYGASEWQLPVLGLVFLTVGVGNIVMTLRTYHQKGWSDHSKRE